MLAISPVQPWYAPSLLSVSEDHILTRKLQAITGSSDYTICDGECKGIFEHPAQEIWKNARFTPHLHPDASHNINFHFNATGAYEVITSFLDTSLS